MESQSEHDSVRRQLHEIERGEAASWVVYPPTPAWWPVAYGIWAAAFALVVGLLEGGAKSLSQLGLICLVGVMAVWDRRRRGTYPTGRPPRALNGPILRMVAGAVAVAVAAWVAGELVGVWPAAAVAGLGAWAVVTFYEREYAAVAADIREGLA